MNIVQDVKTAVNIFGAVRKARKSGAGGVQIKPVQALPIITLPPGYYNTIEGCLVHKLGRDTDMAVKAVFKGLPYETQRRLEFTPKKPGEWVERARFWQQELESALPPRMKHEVMILFIGWYVHCLKNTKNAALSVSSTGSGRVEHVLHDAVSTSNISENGR